METSSIPMNKNATLIEDNFPEIVTMKHSPFEQKAFPFISKLHQRQKQKTTG